METQPTQPLETTVTTESFRMITNPRELIQDVGRWAESQPWHPKHAPDYGCVEELGEMCHGVLKNIQGIKGMDDLEKFRAHTLDALGDFMVFLSHWCFLRNCHFTALPIERVIVPEHIEMRDYIGQLLINLSQMFTIGVNMRTEVTLMSTIATRLCHTLQHIAKMFGWDLLENCLYPTWHRVRFRNFNKDKVGGGRDKIESMMPAPSTAPRQLPTVKVDPAQIEGEKPLEAKAPAV